MSDINKTAGETKKTETIENIKSQIERNKNFLTESESQLKQKFQEIKDCVAKANYPFELNLSLPQKLFELSIIEKKHRETSKETTALEKLLLKDSSRKTAKRKRNQN